MTPDYIRVLAGYNAWANQRLYDACASLPQGELARQRPSFFGSILATLNHILLADRVWLARIEGGDAGFTRLDEMLYADLAELRGEREKSDADFKRVAEATTPDSLAQDILYRTMAGEESRTKLGWILTHMVNHQTHHRGQIHDMLSQTEITPPSMDLIYYLRLI